MLLVGRNLNRWLSVLSSSVPEYVALCWVCTESEITVSVINQSILILSECGPIESIVCFVLLTRGGDRVLHVIISVSDDLTVSSDKGRPQEALSPKSSRSGRLIVAKDVSAAAFILSRIIGCTSDEAVW